MNELLWSDEGRAELFAAHAGAQSDMAAVVKGALNPAFRSKYADLATVLEAILPALNKHGLALIQSPSFDGEVVTVETILAHSGGGWLRSGLSLRPTKADPQGVGSAITYARRYALLAICGAAPEDDDGNAASQPGEAGKPFEDRRVVNPATGRLIDPMSPNQARKDGRGERAAALAHEIDDLQGVAEAMAWKREHEAEIATWPTSWALKLSEQFEQHLADLRALVVREVGEEEAA